MFSYNTIADFMLTGYSSLPTPDALVVALLEQQKLLEQKDAALEEKDSALKSQQARINVLEEQLRLMKQRKFGTSSQKNRVNQNFATVLIGFNQT